MPAPAKIRFIPKAERDQIAKRQQDEEEKIRQRKQLDLAAAPKFFRHDDVHSKASKRPLDSQDDQNAKYFREKYLGPDKSKSTFSAQKKRRRTRDKFNFDWDPSEDTSVTHPDATEPQSKPYEEKSLSRVPRGGDLGKHWTEKSLAEMRERDWRILKEDYNIQTKGGNLPYPMRSWEESGLPHTLLEVIATAGYNEPSAIQRASIPIALSQRDLIGVAITGSGKTAAFILPLLVYIDSLPRLDDISKTNGPYALVLAPTRELAQQIEVETRKFANPLGFNVTSLTGGHNMAEQAKALETPTEIVIATPGRLVDCLEQHVLVLSQVTYLIFDECDRMLNMGFEEPLTKILKFLPSDNEKPENDTDDHRSRRYRQTMMFTATMPPSVLKIAKQYLRRPAEAIVSSQAGESTTDLVEQRVEWVTGEDRRRRRLQDILMQGDFGPPIIIFVNTKHECDPLARFVRSNCGRRVATLYGSMKQSDREESLEALRNGDAEILVATDVAARGIDIAEVSLVVQFSLPKSLEQYVHRLGRTGRAGLEGVGITFIGPEDSDNFYELRQMIQRSGRSRVPEELRKHPASQQKSSRSGGGFKDESSGFGSRNGGMR